MASNSPEFGQPSRRITLVDLEKSSMEANHRHAEAKWQTGVKARFPWVGFTALMMVFLAAAASVTILMVSNNKPQSEWPKWVAPNVVLAGVNAFANVMLGVAINRGIAIAWWRKIIKGTTVEDLHRSWSFRDGLYGFFKGYQYWNLIALAAIAAKIAIIDSILLQRATTTYSSSDPVASVAMTVPRLMDFPITGTILGDNKITTTMDPEFLSSAVDLWNVDSVDGSISLAFQGCSGACEGSFDGIGFSYACTETREAVNYSESQWMNGKPAPIFSTSFDVNWMGNDHPYTSIIYNGVEYISNSNTGDCNGTIVRARCEARPAIVDMAFTTYQISTQATGQLGIMKVGHLLSDRAFTGISALDSGNQVSQWSVKEPLTVSETGAKGQTRMGGLALALTQYLGASANITYNSATKAWEMQQSGTYALANLVRQNDQMKAGTCNYNFAASNTTRSILENINWLTLSMNAASLINGAINNKTIPAETSQNITAIAIKPGIRYKTNSGYMIGAAICMVSCALLVMPAYWGFWELGRKATLSPIEIAAAFRAPDLDDPGVDNADVKTLLHVVGEKRIRYGMMTVKSEGRLGVGQADWVRPLDGRE